MLIRTWKSDGIRMLCNPKCYLAVFGAAILNWLTIADEWKIAGNGASVFYYIVSKEGLGAFCILLAIVTAWPFGGSFLEDKTNRVFPYLIQRGNFHTYCISKVCMVFLGAFLGVFLGDLLTFGGLNLGTAFFYEREAEMYIHQRYILTAGSSPLLYCIMEFSSEAAGYAFASLITLPVSVISDNSFVVLASPILFYYGSLTLNQLWKLPGVFYWQNIRSNSFLFLEAGNDLAVWGLTMGYFLTGAVLMGVLFWWILKRRVQKIV